MNVLLGRIFSTNICNTFHFQNFKIQNPAKVHIFSDSNLGNKTLKINKGILQQNSG